MKAIKLFGITKAITLLNLVKKSFHNIYKKRSKNIAIFASNDQMAVGFIHAALENNQQIPKDYAIIGYDNILFSKIFFPKLTTIDTDVDRDPCRPHHPRPGVATGSQDPEARTPRRRAVDRQYYGVRRR